MRFAEKVDVVAFEPEADPAGIDVATRKLRQSTAERYRVKVAKLKLQRDADAKLEEQDELGRRTITAALPRARRAYESYFRLPVGCSSDSQVANSSAGVSGWAKFADVLDDQMRRNELPELEPVCASQDDSGRKDLTRLRAGCSSLRRGVRSDEMHA